MMQVETLSGELFATAMQLSEFQSRLKFLRTNIQGLAALEQVEAKIQEAQAHLVQVAVDRREHNDDWNKGKL